MLVGTEKLQGVKEKWPGLIQPLKSSELLRRFLMYTMQLRLGIFKWPFMPPGRAESRQQ